MRCTFSERAPTLAELRLRLNVLHDVPYFVSCDSVASPLRLRLSASALDGEARRAEEGRFLKQNALRLGIAATT